MSDLTRCRFKTSFGETAIQSLGEPFANCYAGNFAANARVRAASVSSHSI
jgi:hypothetical protein